MARPLRPAFAGAFYYIVACGDRRSTLFDDDLDRGRLLDLLRRVCVRYGWRGHAYCLLPDRYELLIETPWPTLAPGMRQLNGVYAQTTNRRRGQRGAVFAGRYRAVILDPGRYLARVARHMALAPWRAGLTLCPAAFAWSSCAATLGWVAAPAWLESDDLLAPFGDTHAAAVAGFAEYLKTGMSAGEDVRVSAAQRVLGDAAFVQRLATGTPGPAAVAARPALATVVAGIADRREAMCHAYATGGYSLKQIASHFGVHYATVSRALGRSAR